MKDIWQTVKANIEQQIPAHCYKMWIEPLAFSSGDGGQVTVTCPNFFSKKRVNEHYAGLIASEIHKISGRMCTLSLRITDKPARKADAGDDDGLQLPLPHTRIQPGRLLRKNFTFDRFVVGGNNDFAYSAALSLASRKSSGQTSLYLCSQTGMGKSHLSQAVGHHILTDRPMHRVCYVTAEDFTNEMVRAYKSNTLESFKERYRNHCDALILEDVHFLAGKERTQIELSAVLDYLIDAEKKVIFSSCCLPGDIPKLSDQLRSRFFFGLISNIEPPDFSTRLRILRKKSDEFGRPVPDDVLEFLADALTENVRMLESGLIGVTAKSSLLGAPINLNLARSVVKNIVKEKKTITIEAIKKLVCRHYNISLEEIVSRSRKHAIVRPRQMAIYLSRKYTDQSIQVIGKSFNRYHATAIHAINAIESGMKADGTVQEQVDYLRKKLESGEF